MGLAAIQREISCKRELRVSRRSQFLGYCNLNVFCSHFGTGEYNRRKIEPNTRCMIGVCNFLIFLFL
jgi:hypothetical protein